MSLTREEVKHIARLARLALHEDEIERFQRQLSDILEYAGRLNRLDTRDIPPTGAVHTEPVLRPDEPAEPLPQADLLRNAPRTQDGQFRVPPIIEDHHDEPC